MDSGAAKTYVLSWLSKSTSDMEMVKNEVSVSADSSSPEMMDLHIKALGLMGPARSEFEDASKASSLYFSEPFRIASISVDSQNRAGALVRSSAICAIRKDGSAAILSFR